ncbi:MerR family transcriptional regulator [Streptomyces diastatochromogenes]|nr:MerR family transcriptional regulator [Streptomyces diastatochromogenes]
MTTGALARRLGVSPTTVRSWDRRYGIGPADRGDGRHRRWSPADVAMLEEMCRLTASGVPPAEAARAARRSALAGLADLAGRARREGRRSGAGRRRHAGRTRRGSRVGTDVGSRIGTCVGSRVGTCVALPRPVAAAACLWETSGRSAGGWPVPPCGSTRPPWKSCSGRRWRSTASSPPGRRSWRRHCTPWAGSGSRRTTVTSRWSTCSPGTSPPRCGGPP